jgi:hypothetical protein
VSTLEIRDLHVSVEESASMRFRPLERRVLSTVTGDVLPPGTDLRGLLVAGSPSHEKDA